MSHNSTKSNRWTEEEKLFFMQLLKGANEKVTLISKEEAALKPVLESFIQPLEERFGHPFRSWNYTRLKRQYRQFKDDYLVYCRACGDPGARKDGGRVYVDPAVWQTFEKGYEESQRLAAKRVRRDGLRTGGSITADVYHSIFSKNPRIVNNEVEPSFQADADSSTVGSCRLRNMPPEILSLIVSHLGRQDLKVFVSMTRFLRETLSYQLFSKVKLAGTLVELKEKAQLLPKQGFLKHTSYITFHITGIGHSKCSESDSIPPVPMAEDIGDCLREIAHLQGVVFTFDLSSEQASHLKKHFKTTKKWIIPRIVTFYTANPRCFETVLLNFSPGILQAVRLPIPSPQALKTQYDILKKRHRLLKALHVHSTVLQYRHQFHHWLSPDDSWAICHEKSSAPLLCMDDKFLEIVNEDFPKLESLIIDESDSRKSSCLKYFHDVDFLEETTRRLVIILKQMESLQRFAFKLRSCLVYRSFIRKIFTPEDDRTPPTQLELYYWYAELLKEILAKTNLEELCILDVSVFYRGTRKGAKKTDSHVCQWVEKVLLLISFLAAETKG
ncbi:hypothetical protein FSARC_8868 [Fusarium sarcochroum]|uniref:Uncharacterized protein n=1 Tax=Fusarium sarcochroum TaxID=1208366 RepID=A0A8H4X6I3_9HYPO|nr:hypothetical protein FSARC_8868 [Fusarium sarcochroum]